MDNTACESRKVNIRRKKNTKEVCIGIDLDPSVEIFVLMMMAYQYGIMPRKTENGFEIYQVIGA